MSEKRKTLCYDTDLIVSSYFKAKSEDRSLTKADYITAMAEKGITQSNMQVSNDNEISNDTKPKRTKKKGSD